MSNSVFQSVIQQLKDIPGRTFGVVDSEGCVVSCTDLALLGQRWPEVMPLLTGSEQPVTFEQKTFRAITNSMDTLEYVAFCSGDDEQAKLLCNMAYISLRGARNYYEEKHDRGTFVKNIIMDNILPGDIYIRAKELHFVTDAPRAVFLVRQVGRSDVAIVDVLSGLFPDKLQDFVLSINETDVAVVKLLDDASCTPEALEKIAVSIEDTLKNDLFIKSVIGIGTVSEHLRELADSYKEAQTAIDVGKVFDTEKSIINYENLGIGRLIYQLPTTLCDIFLTEVFKKNSIDALDQETLFTINKFFENNLNVSETSRKLFVHRNTLVYRLEKIKKLTGLDLRQFDHAIVFKVALMVRKYLSSRDIR